jgi:hypothetical protein
MVLCILTNSAFKWTNFSHPVNLRFYIIIQRQFGGLRNSDENHPGLKRNLAVFLQPDD